MKRMTETAKWDDPWFRELKGVHKLIFLYVVDRCDNAGFWEVDESAMSFHTKLEQSHFEGAWKGLSRGFVIRDGWLWVKRFLLHQKNDSLNPDNAAHRQIIALLKKQSERFPEAMVALSEKSPMEGPSKAPRNGKGLVQDKEGGVERGKCTAEEAKSYAAEIGLPESDGEWFYDKSVGSGWKNNGKPIVCWRATIRAWRGARIFPSLKNANGAVARKGPNI
jgi:hypothetical protein